MSEQHRRPVEGHSAHDTSASDKDLDQRWTEFSQARASLAEVMSDDELRALGVNVEVLDERP